MRVCGMVAFKRSFLRSRFGDEERPGRSEAPQLRTFAHEIDGRQGRRASRPPDAVSAATTATDASNTTVIIEARRETMQALDPRAESEARVKLGWWRGALRIARSCWAGPVLALGVDARAPGRPHRPHRYAQHAG